MEEQNLNSYKVYNYRNSTYVDILDMLSDWLQCNKTQPDQIELFLYGVGFIPLTLITGIRRTANESIFDESDRHRSTKNSKYLEFNNERKCYRKTYKIFNAGKENINPAHDGITK